MNVKAWLDIYDETQYRDGDWNVHIIAEVMRALLDDNIKLSEDREALVRYVRRLKELVDKQAQEDGLWFDADYATEEYLQEALRYLHKRVEEYNVLSQELREKIA